MKISACLITKNEEQNIVRCIESFKESVYEIIVVDTGSTDNTVKIARELGARVYQFKWDNNFANARNYAIKKAKGEWIVFLDADEHFFGGTGKNIPEVLKVVSPAREIDCLYCKCMDVDQTGQPGSSNYRIRIFRNDKKIKYKGSIHESLHTVGKKICYLIIPENELKIYHTGYQSADKVKEKHRRNLELLLKELNRGKCEPLIHAYLSFSYVSTENYELAIKHANLFLDSGEEAFTMNVMLYLNLIKAMKLAGYDFLKIDSVINKALGKFPVHPDLYYSLGKLLVDEKRYNEALAAFEQGLKCGSRYNDMEGTSWPSYVPEIYHFMGHLSELKNDVEEARDYYTQSLKNNKWSFETLLKLIGILKSLKADDVLTVLSSLYDENRREELDFLVTALAKVRFEPVLKHYYAILNKKYGHDEVSYVFLLLASKKYQEVFEYFNEYYIQEKNELAAFYAAVGALLGNDPENIEQVRKYEIPSLRRLVECYCGRENVSLNKEDFQLYLNLLNEFIYLDADEQIEVLLGFKNQFEEDVSSEIGDFSLNAGKFNLALKSYFDALETDEYNAVLCFKIGFCYYKTLDYRKALGYMNQALELEYLDNDVNEFLKWINDRS